MAKVTAKRDAPFRATRLNHMNEAAEDYTELIADLISKNGKARICDIAKHLGVSHVTALRTIKRLERLGFVTTANYKPVSLTKKGQQIANASKSRHRIVLEFLLALGIPKKTAEIDAEGMEHHISPTTLNAMRRHLDKRIS